MRARYFYDFGWGAGKEGIYNVLDDRCLARWNDDLKLESAVICQIGFDLYCDGGWSSVTQSAYVDYVLIHI